MTSAVAAFGGFVIGVFCVELFSFGLQCVAFDQLRRAERSIQLANLARRRYSDRKYSSLECK